MTIEALRITQAEHATMLRVQSTLRDATDARDAAILDARQAGASAIEIADALRISRQQIHKIIGRRSEPLAAKVHALRAEVVEVDTRFEDLTEDAQWFVESEVPKLAKDRGLSLDWPD